MKSTTRSFLVGILLALGACDDNKRSAAPPAQPGRFLVTADTQVLTPGATVPRFDLSAFGAPRVDGAYRVTTPAGEPFAFELFSWERGAAGLAGVRVAHVTDGGRPVLGDGTSMARAGLVPTGAGLMTMGEWLWASGDGMARLTIQGSITETQVLLVGAGEGDVRLFEIAIGPRSVVNQDPANVPEHPSVVSRDTLYSSDSWSFGQPTVAISGDRTSIVVYEGDRATPAASSRYEMRLQHDRATGAVTGGGVVDGGFDGGNWRDHECAALFNVFALVRASIEGPLLRLSFDRGATFAQEVLLDASVATRLVQIAMAADYSLAITYWRQAAAGLEFVVVDGGPVAADPHGSPTWFGFGAPQVLHTMPADAMPLTTGMAWSEGGDLVVGYGASWFEPGAFWTSTTEFHCAVRPHRGEFTDRVVDAESIVARDPSVAVLGQGSTLRIVYAYEVAGGVRIAHSDDAGATFTLGDVCGGPGAWLPSVFVRQRAGTQVDLLFLAQAASGWELHHARWLDFPAGPREDFVLTRASFTPTPPQVRQVAAGRTVPYDFGWRIRQLGWLGYDAVLDGDDLVVVYDEHTVDGAFLCLGVSMSRFETSTNVQMPGGGFLAASPPPLAPGMTEPMPAPVSSHAHQLHLLRLR